MVQTKKRVTISIDKQVIKLYKRYCKNNGLKVSSQLELFMKMQYKNKGLA